MRGPVRRLAAPGPEGSTRSSTWVFGFRWTVVDSQSSAHSLERRPGDQARIEVVTSLDVGRLPAQEQLGGALRAGTWDCAPCHDCPGHALPSPRPLFALRTWAIVFWLRPAHSCRAISRSPPGRSATGDPTLRKRDPPFEHEPSNVTYLNAKTSRYGVDVDQSDRRQPRPCPAHWAMPSRQPPVSVRVLLN